MFRAGLVLGLFIFLFCKSVEQERYMRQHYSENYLRECPDKEPDCKQDSNEYFDPNMMPLLRFLIGVAFTMYALSMGYGAFII